jgi:hypothetical protein
MEAGDCRLINTIKANIYAFILVDFILFLFSFIYNGIKLFPINYIISSNTRQNFLSSYIGQFIVHNLSVKRI